MKRTATAKWSGDGMTGQGALTTQSGALTDQPYSFKTRFESQDGKAGTNPEELMGAAHAGCFTMAVSFALAAAGFRADQMTTTAEVEMANANGQFSISGITLTMKAKIPEITNQKFQEIAAQAKAGCPISKALASVPMKMTAELLT